MDVTCHKCAETYDCGIHEQQGYCKKCLMEMRPEIFYNSSVGLWYHWDEAYCDHIGPFDSYEEAEAALHKYADWLNLGTVNDRIDGVLNITAHRLKEANEKRGNAWRDIGVCGLFLEVRTMYLRLRAMVWDELINSGTDFDWYRFTKEHKKGVANCLLDMRAYTTLLELAMQDDNYFGTGKDEDLKDGINERK